MYLTLKVLIDFNSVNFKLIENYTRVFTNEVKRAADFLKKTGYPLDKECISNDVNWHCKVNVLKEAKRVSKLKRVTKNYVIAPIWNPASYVLEKDKLTLHFGNSFIVSNTCVRLIFDEFQWNRLKECTLRSVKIRRVGRFYFAYFTIFVKEKARNKGNLKMGIDLGVRVPAVCVTSNGKVKFIGNGRYLRYFKCSMNAKYQQLDKAKKQYKIKKLDHKLARKKFYLDHAYSRQIINFAKENGISVIKLEKLKGLQLRNVLQKRNEYHDWSYYRMQTFIEQKGRLEGIVIQYIDPKFTSKKCPNCGKLNSVQGRSYVCSCGYHKHRDLVGAINILNSTSIV